MPRKPAIKVPVPKAKAAKAPKAKGYNGGVGAGYESTRYTGRRSFLWLSPAQDQRRDLTPQKRSEMLKKLRWGERNSGMVRQIVGDLVLYTVGDGFRAQAHSADPAWNTAAEAYFAEWSRRCDITGRFSFNDLLRISERRWVLDGDFFLAKVRNGTGAAKLQGIEAHRVGDPEGQVPERMHDGILFGAYGEVQAYNVYRSDGSSRLILANAMMQVYDPEYVSGARGLPLLQHSLNDIQDEMEILALEKSAVKDAAEITRVLKKAGGEFGPDLASELASNPQAADALGVGLGGKFLALEPGEDLVSFQSNRPSPTFNGFLEAIQRDIARGILPYEFTNDPSKIGGAVVRLVVAKMDRVASRHQQILIDQICNPTWGYVIGDAIAKGELPDIDGWNKSSWTTPKRVTVDAGREAAQDRADLEAGLKSMSELYSERGMDFKEEMTRRADDMAFILETSKRTGVPVWMLYKPGFNWLQQGMKQTEGDPNAFAEQTDVDAPPFQP
jgi:lambda family phage portal protein